MLTLDQAIHSVENHCYLTRIFNSAREIGKEKGVLRVSALVGIMAVTVLSAMGLSSFCVEGVVRSFIEVKHDKRRIIRLRPLGDVGGWCSLALFSLIVVREIFEGFIKEGEFIQIRKKCSDWIQTNRHVILEDPEVYNRIYQKINEHLEMLNARCLFSKSIVSIRIKALEIYPESLDEQHLLSNHSDKKLEQVYRRIHASLEKKTCKMNYLSRLNEAKKVIMQKDRSTQLITLIFGIVIPIIMVLNVLFSIVGEFGLGKELYVDRKELTDVGHFGEWPINAVEALTAAYLLHKWYVTDEGDLALARRIYTKQLRLLQNDPVLYNRLAKTGNQEMSLLASNCKYFKHPTDYKFERI